MSFIAKNPLSLPEINYTPSTPSGTRGLFPKSDGWYSIDKDGVEKKLLDLDDMKGLERLQYYGDANIIPTDESYFEIGNTEYGTTIYLKQEYRYNDILTEVVIPYKSDTEIIKAISDGGFESFGHKIKKIILPNTIVSIGSGAFNNCVDLIDVNIPNSVTEICSYAFYGCSSLTQLILPDSILRIGDDAFDNCSSDLTIICSQGSVADTYAKENRIKVKYDVIDADSLNNSSGGTGAVSSVNGQIGEVELKLEDINDNIVADESMFQYKASESASFYFGSSRMSATGSTNGGYSLTANVNGLSISGNPYNDNDITLVQNNWVDENDQSQGIVTTTHKLSEKADKATTLAGYGITDGISFVEGYEDKIDYYQGKVIDGQWLSVLYKIIGSKTPTESSGGSGTIILTPGKFNEYYLYAVTYNEPFNSYGDGMDVTQIKLGYDGLYIRKGHINGSINTRDWGEWKSLESKDVDLSGYYTKDEINSKLSSVYKYKGTKDYYFELPTEKEVGDVYNIRYASGENYEEKPMLYSNYNIYDATIPPFSETGLEGFYIEIEYDSKPAFLNGETLDIRVYSPYLDSTMTNFKVPILDSCPDPATSCAYYGSGYVTIFVVKSEAPFSNAANSSEYDTRYDEIYDKIINHPWSPNEKPLLDFGEIKYEFISPIAVNDGDNVAWTGTEWDVLGGTEDMSLYAQTDLSNVDNATFKAKAESAGVGGGSIDLSDCEKISNKTTEINADSTDDQYPSAKAVWDVTKNAGGAVSSVNGQVGEVELKLEDINDNVMADDSGFTYSGAGVDFWMNLTGLSFSTQSYNGLSLGLNGLVYSGSPFTNDDVILNQISWVDENDQSQGIVTTTHKLSEKANKSEVDNMIGDIDVALEGIIELQLQHGAWIEGEGDTNVGGNTGEPPSVDLPEYEGDD